MFCESDCTGLTEGLGEIDPMWSRAELAAVDVAGLEVPTRLAIEAKLFSGLVGDDFRALNVANNSFESRLKIESMRIMDWRYLPGW